MTRWMLAVALSLPLPAGAVELADGKLGINGFGSWGVGFTNNKNELAIANSTGTLEEADFGLVATARPIDPLSISFQTFFTAGNKGATAELDWVFAEWRFSDALKLRAGRVKMPVGLFGEIPDVGTLRPLFLLPQGIYGRSETMAEAYNGAGLTGGLELPRDWGLEYDAFAGALKVSGQSPLSFLHPSIPPEPDEVQLQALGGRVTLLPPVEGLRFVVSGYFGQTVPTEAIGEGLDVPRNLVFAIGVSAEYAGPRFSARGEYFFRTEQREETSHSGYLEAAYFLTKEVQVVSRMEVSTVAVPWHTGISPLKRHDEIGVGLDYWFSPQMVAKASYHFIYGNRLATPVNLPEVVAAGTLQPLTHVLILGTQFSF